MRILQRLRFFVVVAFVGVSCAHSDWTGSGPPPFKATPIAPGQFKIELNNDGLAPAASSVMAMCASAQLTLDQGYEYFRFDEGSRVRLGKATYTLVMSNSPEPGYEVVDMASISDDAAASEESFYLVAQTAIYGCREAGFSAEGQSD